MLISELAKRTGLAIHTIRFYEREGLIDERFFERSKNKYRRYTEEAVERLMMIKQGQMAGFTLAEISMLIEAWEAGELGSKEQIIYIEQKVAEINAQIAGLEAIRTYLMEKLSRLRKARTDFDLNDLALVQTISGVEVQRF
jgi:MerR family transcriptional regulator, copper efflux regulator